MYDTVQRYSITFEYCFQHFCSMLINSFLGFFSVYFSDWCLLWKRNQLCWHKCRWYHWHFAGWSPDVFQWRKGERESVCLCFKRGNMLGFVLTSCSFAHDRQDVQKNILCHSTSFQLFLLAFCLLWSVIHLCSTHSYCSSYPLIHFFWHSIFLTRESFVLFLSISMPFHHNCHSAVFRWWSGSFSPSSWPLNNLPL